MYPRVVAPGDGNQLLERVEDAGVELARLHYDDGWRGGIGAMIGGQRMLQRLGIQAPPIVGIEAD